MSMKVEQCPICGAEAKMSVMLRGVCSIHECRGCDAHFARYFRSSPAAPSGREDHFRSLDLEKYERSVRALREASYGPLLPAVRRFAPRGRWLDVGCSYGWLLKHVRDSGFEPFGVEPSAGAAGAARAEGLDVQEGLFPGVTGGGAPYSVVSFMDVLEHLPDPHAVLERTGEVLAADGVVVIQVPDRACLLYLLAEGMCRWSLGRAAFALRRLWLADLDFPHLFYFNRMSIGILLERAGYELLDSYRSAIGSPATAKDRIGYVSGQSANFVALVATGVAAVNRLDELLGHGGLLTVVARPRKAGCR
jgi:SAM-dependent methyltransferase